MKATLFLVVGLLMIVGAVIWGNGVRQFVRDAARAPGTISDLRAGGSHPTVTFTTQANETISYAQNGWIFGYKVGDRVTVLYDPANPKATASIDAIGAVAAGPVFLIVLGAVFSIVGIVNLGLLRRAF